MSCLAIVFASLARLCEVEKMSGSDSRKLEYAWMFGFITSHRVDRMIAWNSVLHILCMDVHCAEFYVMNSDAILWGVKLHHVSSSERTRWKSVELSDFEVQRAKVASSSLSWLPSVRPRTIQRKSERGNIGNTEQTKRCDRFSKSLRDLGNRRLVGTSCSSCFVFFTVSLAEYFPHVIIQHQSFCFSLPLRETIPAFFLFGSTNNFYLIYFRNLFTRKRGDFSWPKTRDLSPFGAARRNWPVTSTRCVIPSAADSSRWIKRSRVFYVVYKHFQKWRKIQRFT